MYNLAQPCAGLYVYNKMDLCSMEEVDEIARRPHSIPISCYHKLNFDGLLARIWDMMVRGRGRAGGFPCGGLHGAAQGCVCACACVRGALK